MYGKAGHPVFSNASMTPTQDDMKHLEFLRVYGQYYCTKVAYAYNSSCAFLPNSCRTGLRSIENKVTNISAPLLTGLQQGSERVLWSLDSKVCLRSLLPSLHQGTCMASSKTKARFCYTMKRTLRVTQVTLCRFD